MTVRDAHGNVIEPLPAPSRAQLWMPNLLDLVPEIGSALRYLNGKPDWVELFKAYEAIRGSHPIEGGGDRVRLSRELERDGIETSLIPNWQHTNAKRAAQRKERRLQRLYPKKAPSLSVRYYSFPNSRSRSRDCRLSVAVTSRWRLPARSSFSATARSLSQRQLAALVGRSQGQISNAIRGHDPIKASVVNRLRDVLLTAPDQQELRKA